MIRAVAHVAFIFDDGLSIRETYQLPGGSTSPTTEDEALEQIRATLRSGPFPMVSAPKPPAPPSVIDYGGARYVRDDL